jgi:biopolymer transport protein ExbB
MMALFERRQIWFALLILLGLTAFGTFTTSRVHAQDEKAAAEEGGGDEAAAEGEGEGEKKAKNPHAQESYFWWFIRNSGAIGAVILVLSIYFVSTVGRLFLEMRPTVAMPPDVVDECEELLQKRQFKEVFAAVKEDQSMWGRIVSTGIAELPNGLAEAREAADRVAEVIQVENEKKISMLAVLGSMGPMIGLLGTLKGMIGSFAVIARSDQQIKASEVAENLSEALLLTFEGVALALPAIYFFAVFKNKVMHLGVTTLLNADEFIRRFAHAARSKGSPAAAAAPAAQPAAAKVAK